MWKGGNPATHFYNMKSGCSGNVYHSMASIMVRQGIPGAFSFARDTARGGGGGGGRSRLGIGES